MTTVAKAASRAKVKSYTGEPASGSGSTLLATATVGSVVENAPGAAEIPRSEPTEPARPSPRHFSVTADEDLLSLI